MMMHTTDPRCPTCDTPTGYTTQFNRRRSLQMITACLLVGAAAGGAISSILRGVR